MTELKELQFTAFVRQSLIDNGYDNVEKIREEIVNNGGKNLLKISKFGPIVVGKIRDQVIHIQKHITKADIKDIFVNFLIEEIIENKKVIKNAVTGHPNYLQDNVLFEDDDLYIKVDYLAPLFAKYMKDRYIVDKCNISGGQGYLRLAVSQMKDESFIYFNENNGIKYAFNSFFRVTANNDNYLKVYMDILQVYVNRNIELVVDTEMLDEAFLRMLNGESFEITPDTPEFKEPELEEKIEEEKKTFTKDYILLSSCKNVIGNTYLLTFQISSRSMDNKLEFESKNTFGTYQFEKDDIENGELLIPNSCKISREWVREKIVKLL